MKSISYTTSLSPTVLESYLTSSNLKDSQFFIKKDFLGFIFSNNFLYK